MPGSLFRIKALPAERIEARIRKIKTGFLPQTVIIQETESPHGCFAVGFRA